MKRNISILLIDDEENYLFVIREMLIDEGYIVKTCNDASSALLLLEKEEYNIVITDVKMPKYSGKEVVEHIHMQYPDIPIIVITAFGSIENAISFMKEGVFHYITKPFDNEELICTVHNAAELVFARKQYRDLYNQVHKKSREQYPLITYSKAMKGVVQYLNAIHESEAHMLIEGEDGVGKKYLVHHIISRTYGYSKEVEIVNIDGKTEEELKDILFGTSTTSGVLAKHNLNILLDNISLLPYRLQVQLAEYIEQYSKEGKKLPRLFATSSLLLEEEVKEGRFSKGLYYQLAVLRLYMPSLRERREDIPYLVVEILKELATQEGIAIKNLSAEVIQYFTNYEWYGNIKELQAILHKIMITIKGEDITIQHLPSELQKENARFTSAVDLLPISLNLADTLEKIEEQLIRRALVHCNFVQARAAALLGISKSRLQYKLMKYGINGHHRQY